MIKLSNYVANFIADAGIKHVFMLTGGGAMHLNDSLGKHPALQVIPLHHEQACAMAAESYARLSNQIALLNVTTGPGGINAINGVFGAWTDSIPMLIISGQVRYDTTINYSQLGLRQLGDQECNIISMVKDITKYAVLIADPQMIQYHLHKALYLATTGRPGPVWLDIPMNVQGAMIDATRLPAYDPKIDNYVTPPVTMKQIQLFLKQLHTAQRPVILAGAGIRLAKAHELFLQLVERLKIPVTTAWNGHDILPDAHPYNIGKPGSIGDRAGNFAVQNADLLIVLGSRLNIRQISYNWQAFAREAFKIMVDIDCLELIKPTLSIDQAIHADLADFLSQALQILSQDDHCYATPEWLSWCLTRKQQYPVVLKQYWEISARVNPYCFMQALSEVLPENQIIVTGDGTACVTSFQAIKIKQGQRLYTNSGCASMGYDLPAAIGACIASGGEKIVCLAGDGSIQLNLQELASIIFNRYPIKIFILNNNGYHSIRQTQANFFGEPFVGVGPDSGLGFPDFSKLAAAYGFRFIQCTHHAALTSAITHTLADNDSAICEVFLTPEQQFAPKLSSKRLADGRMVSRPLEDLAPFLPREELQANMLIEMLAEN